MKKIIVLLLCLLAFAGSGLWFYLQRTQNQTNNPATVPVVAPTVSTRPTASPEPNLPTEEPIINKAYRVIAGGGASKGFDDYQSAYEYAKDIPNATIWSDAEGRIIQDNQKPFEVYYTSAEHEDFDNYADAVAFAKAKSGAYVYYAGTSSVIWADTDILPATHQILNVPHIEQMPHYPRGCEIVSLAMLIEYNGLNVSKAELAQKVKKDTTQRLQEGNSIYWGNPNDGFVGDMFDFSKPGLGVYHGPIFELLHQYFPGSAMDITGTDFDDVLAFVSKDRPVWVIANSWFDLLPDSEFETWSTPSGKIDVTYREHSVLITGYDENYIYFNDPLSSESDSKAPREGFAAAWVQMGRQAVTVAQ